ncbi:conserved unknown protein [Ectocarpus siliculosus]|uniref:25S rRNA (uridine-N(3))-methyltransferase BMT5-like domain-containing protein n=1 Tax=Ectocarpus siliculosus TaxID=2880 RepID=D8LED8_ECTSI|nr:conserved unknown protein [Ectocarpus siliculosus]|eukprot:CBN74224.1 conserved unknown protein [Ectocarpus siliculosus]
MGKFRGHQDRSWRGRENKILKKKVGVAVGGIHAAAQAESTVSGGDSLGSGNPGHQQQQQQREAVGPKRKLKHVTYAKEHSVLLVGDGCFSFNCCVEHRGTRAGVVATSLDSLKAVLKKYPQAETWLPKLEADGPQARENPSRGGWRPEGRCGVSGEKNRIWFHRVVFNFPHTGAQSTHLNRDLILDFFASTKGLVKCAAVGGHVHVTLKDKPPFSGWNGNVEGKRADHGGVPGDPSVFPGYLYSTTDPQAMRFNAEGARRTNVLCPARSELDDNASTVEIHSYFPYASNHSFSPKTKNEIK